jgi:hypothetical protein
LRSGLTVFLRLKNDLYPLNKCLEKSSNTTINKAILTTLITGMNHYNDEMNPTRAPQRLLLGEHSKKHPPYA